MIGFNMQKITELYEAIKAAYSTIGSTMADGWPTVSTVLETEWIGPDEVDFEKQLAERICALYIACEENIQAMLAQISNLALNWMAYQTSNTLSGEQLDVSAYGELGGGNIGEPVTPYDITASVKGGNPTFTADTNFGIKDGAASATTIKEAIDTYVGGVYDKVKSLMAEIDSSQAFLGAEQSGAINTYIQNVGEEIAKLTTCVKSLYEALDTLVASGYAAQESNIASIKDADTSVDTGNDNMRG